MAENKYINVNLAKAQFTGNFIDNYPPPLIKALLDSIPAADVEPVKHGKWERIAGIFELIECSNCGKDINCTNYADYYAKHFYFCPNCGAKMDGGEFNE